MLNSNLRLFLSKDAEVFLANPRSLVVSLWGATHRSGSPTRLPETAPRSGTRSLGTDYVQRLERPKCDPHRSYPEAGTVRVLTILLTRWPSIPEQVQDELMLVGGLAIYHHTRGKPNLLGPVCITLDVDLGIALCASNGCYTTLGKTLDGLGFQSTKGGLVREVDRLPIANDFRFGGTKEGGRKVNDIQAPTFHGILKALDSKVIVSLLGTNAYGRPGGTLRPHCVDLDLYLS